MKENGRKKGNVIIKKDVELQRKRMTRVFPL